MATMVDQKVEQGLTLTMTRVIRAPKVRVFEAWLRPEMIRQWFGPPNRKVEDVQVDGHVGRGYKFTMSPQFTEGNVSADCSSGGVAVYGEYKEILPYDRLVFTWRADWQPEEETLVTITLRDVEGGTEMTLEHTRFEQEDSRNGHNQGWTFAMEKMVKVLEA